MQGAVCSVIRVKAVLQCLMQRLVRAVPVSAILGSEEAFWLSLDLNGDGWLAGWSGLLAKLSNS